MGTLIKSIAFGILITFFVVLVWDGTIIYRAVDKITFELFFNYKSFIEGTQSLEKLRLLAYLSLCINNTFFILLGCFLSTLVPRSLFKGTLFVFTILFISTMAFLHIPYHGHSVTYYLVALSFWVILIFLFWYIVIRLRSNNTLNKDATKVAPIS